MDCEAINKNTRSKCHWCRHHTCVCFNLLQHLVWWERSCDGPSLPLPDSHLLGCGDINGQWHLRQNAARPLTFPFHFASNDFTCDMNVESQVQLRGLISESVAVIRGSLWTERRGEPGPHDGWAHVSCSLVPEGRCSTLTDLFSFSWWSVWLWMNANELKVPDGVLLLHTTFTVNGCPESNSISGCRKHCKALSSCFICLRQEVSVITPECNIHMSSYQLCVLTLHKVFFSLCRNVYDW